MWQNRALATHSDVRLPLESKLPEVGTTIFTIMSKLAADEGAINLSQGYPDFDGPAELLDRVSYYLTHGYNQYPPMAGIEPLREAIAAKVLSLYGATVDPHTEVTVTSGATEALFCAIHAVVRPGDEVIVFDPCYDSYEPAVTLAGGICRHIPMAAPGFRVDWGRVRDAIGPKTRLIMVTRRTTPPARCGPGRHRRATHCPGRPRHLRGGGRGLRAHHLRRREHVSLARYADLFARSFVVSSFGKTYHTTGWKVGYCVAPATLSAEFRRVHQFRDVHHRNTASIRSRRFFEQLPRTPREPRGVLPGQADLFCSLLGSSRFRLTPSAGTFFQLVDYSEIANEADADLARRWTIERKVASIPVSVFYKQPPRQNLLRFCFAKDDATLERAAQTLCQL